MLSAVSVITDNNEGIISSHSSNVQQEPDTAGLCQVTSCDPHNSSVCGRYYVLHFAHEKIMH